MPTRATAPAPEPLVVVVLDNTRPLLIVRLLAVFCSNWGAVPVELVRNTRLLPYKVSVPASKRSVFNWNPLFAAVPRSLVELSVAFAVNAMVSSCEPPLTGALPTLGLFVQLELLL